MCVRMCVCDKCARMTNVCARNTAVTTYSSLGFKYAVTVHFNVLHTAAQMHTEKERWTKHFSLVNKTIPVSWNA